MLHFMQALTISEISSLPLAGLRMAEKFDGINARRVGMKVLSRNGTELGAPDWFCDAMPEGVEGELWTARGDFQNTQSIVLSEDAGDRWQAITFLPFDGMDWKAPATHADIASFYDAVIASGGEGIVLRSGSEEWKVKPLVDAEARIIGYKDGKGKYLGKLGSYVVTAINGEADGSTFKLGGMSDAERSNPLPIGSVVRFEYSGLTASGKPRFPRCAGSRDARTMLPEQVSAEVLARRESRTPRFSTW